MSGKCGFAGKRVRIERWLVDETHNNYNYDGTTEFVRAEDSISDGPVSEVVRTELLTKNAVGLMLVTPVD
ncbi:hypothetical protein [Phytoactinopolyspora endophytica]|uniref:hypothetical protein n=1 Tax=Phytoactinopolyspora endophytica TaxID=1642495 RepID=UPI00101BA386|nr:hypothetical protein [Phytoactinopolyspora endophytica]